MTSAVRASVVVIGDEILDGHTRDTNSGWLAARLTELGVPLDRIVTVPDDLAAISEALHGELARSRPRLVMTSGGIGSTPDDLTMSAVAAHLGLRVVAHPVLDERVSVWAQRSRDEGVAIPPEHERAMRKMALVPEGACLLEGTAGVTAGVSVDLDGGVAAGGTSVIILPGVPSELRRIVDEGVAHLLEGLGSPQHVAEVRHPYPESLLSPLLEELVAGYPEVQLGSYPGRECLIRAKGPPEQVEAAMTSVQRRLDELAADETARRSSARWQASWE